MKVAIIGAGGYIGRHLAFYLLQKGWEVHGYGRGQQPDILLSSYSQVDVGDREQLDSIDVNVDFVFYFAGLTGTYKSFIDYRQYIDTNERGIMHLLDRLRVTKSTARVVFPSTRLVYKGIKNTPLPEDAEKEFKTVYALTKWFGEQVLQQYALHFGIPFSIFRICVPYGNLFSSAYSYGTIGFFLSSAVAGKDITLFGDGEPKRTFTHVEDICRQIYQGILNDTSVNKIFNTSGETYSLKEAASLVAGKFGVNLAFVAWPATDAKLESGDTIFDDTLLRQIVAKPLKNTFTGWLNTIVSK